MPLPPLYYRLEGKTPVPIQYENWAALTLDEIRAIGKDVGHRVAYDTFREYEVSTVFLGMDFQHFKGPPLVFETMVFPGNQVWRWPTWEEAEEGHKKIVEALREGKEV